MSSGCFALLDIEWTPGMSMCPECWRGGIPTPISQAAITPYIEERS